MIAHHLQIALPAPLVEFDFAIGERLQKAGDHRKRAFQLMRDVGDKIAPHGFDFLRQGDVAREQELLLLAVGDDGERQHQSLPARQAQGERLGIFALLQVGGEIRVSHQVDQGLAQVALLVQPEVLAGNRVAPLDMAVGVEQDNAIGQGQAGVAKTHQVVAELLLLFDARTHETVEPDQHVFPDATTLRHGLGQGIAQPVGQRSQIGHMPPEEQHQAKADGGKRPHRACERPGDQTGDADTGKRHRAAHPDRIQLMKDKPVFRAGNYRMSPRRPPPSGRFRRQR